MPPQRTTRRNDVDNWQMQGIQQYLTRIKQVCTMHININHHISSASINSTPVPTIRVMGDATGAGNKSTAQTAAGSAEGINVIFDLPIVKETARWHHASAGFPEMETFIKAILKGNYSTWPGLTAEMMRKHGPESVELKKGHMKGPRQGVKSTNPNHSRMLLWTERESRLKEKIAIQQQILHQSSTTMCTSK
jgi:hypothetical protein